MRSGKEPGLVLKSLADFGSEGKESDCIAMQYCARRGVVAVVLDPSRRSF